MNHPNIVKMFAFFADKQYIYLVLELCFSGQLYNYLRKKRKIPEDMAKNIVQQICRALDYMHENEIIHRDLKPENVIYHCVLCSICAGAAQIVRFRLVHQHQHYEGDLLRHSSLCLC